MPRVFITAQSLVSPIGSNVDEFRNAMFAGRSGVTDIRGTLVPEDFPVPYGAPLNLSSLPDPKDQKYQLELERIAAHLWSDFSENLRNVKDLDYVFFCGPEHTADWGHYAIEQDFQPVFLLNHIACQLQRAGISFAPDRLVGMDATCTTGNLLLGRAFHLIRSGRAKRILVGSIERRIRSSVLLPYWLLGAVCAKEFPDARASRPFDRSRSGFVKGEAGSFLLIESEASCEERDAEPLAEVIGYGQTSDGWRLTDGREDFAGTEAALRSALADAHLTTSDIHYINAHGTSTPMNDRLEWRLIEKIFGESTPPVSSLKSQVGHSNLACGLLEAIACTEMLREQRVAPTINFASADPDCRLDFVPNESRAHKMTNVMTNSFGFGGLNASLILRKV